MSIMTKTAEGESQQGLKGRTKWSEAMKKDLLECKTKGLLLVNAEAPRSSNGQKQGYMKIMKDLWEEKGYADLYEPAFTGSSSKVGEVRWAM